MKADTFTTPRLSVAMPLILGLATIAAAPTARATYESVNIINGAVDVTQGSIIDGLDDAFNVQLHCDSPIQVDIVNGFIDVDEDGVLGEAGDDLQDCDLTDESDGPAGFNNGVPATNQVDICDGLVEVNQGACPAEGNDDATDVQLIDLP